MSDARRLAVVFPGRGYTCSTGLLADGITRWRELGYQVLPLDFSAIPFSRIDTFAEAFDRVEAAALEQLAGVDLEHCDDLVFFAKSMGTVAAARCAARLGLHPRMLPLTPLPETLDLTRPGGYRAGHGGGHHRPVHRLAPGAGVLPGAGHSLLGMPGGGPFPGGQERPGGHRSHPAAGTGSVPPLIMCLTV